MGQHKYANQDKNNSVQVLTLHGSTGVDPVFAKGIQRDTKVEFALEDLCQGIKLTNYGDIILQPIDVVTFVTDKLKCQVNVVMLGIDYKFIAIYNPLSDNHKVTAQNSGLVKPLELYPFKEYFPWAVSEKNKITIELESSSLTPAPGGYRLQLSASYKGDLEYTTSGYYIVNYILGDIVRLEETLNLDTIIEWSEFVVIPFIKYNREYLGELNLIQL